MSTPLKETIAVSPNAEQITWNIDVADIMWPLLGIVVAVLVFIALKDKFFPSVKLKNDQGEVSLGGSGTAESQRPSGTSPAEVGGRCQDEDLVELTFLLSWRTFRVGREIETAQFDLVDDEYSNFRAFVSKVEFDPEVLWRHVEDCLVSVVKNNHILQSVTPEDERVDALYLASKVGFVKRRYLELGVHFDTWLEGCITTFLQKMFWKFALIAQEKFKDLEADLDAHGKSSGNPTILRLIERLKKEAGVWA